MEKKKIIFIIIIIVIFVGLFVLISSNIVETQKSSKRKIISTCESINKKIKGKEDLIIYISENINIPNESNDVMDEISKNYKNENLYKIDYRNYNQDCVKEILVKINLYEEIKKDKVPTAVLYKEGEYVGVYLNVMEYKSFENDLDDKGIIEKEEIKEEIILDDYNKHIKDKYILLLVATEEHRENTKEHLENLFKDYRYDTLNIESEEGQKILLEIKKDYKITNEYPQLLYFEDSKLKLNKSVRFSEELFKEFKEELLNNN